MKRKLALILAGLIVMGTVFSSCGDDDSDNSDDTETREEKKDKDADQEKYKEAEKEYKEAEEEYKEAKEKYKEAKEKYKEAKEKYKEAEEKYKDAEDNDKEDEDNDKEAEDEKKLKKLCMGTGGNTGTYYAYGRAMSPILSEEIGIEIDVQSTGASKANIQLIEVGEADIATVQSDMMMYAATGTAIFKYEGTDDFAAVATLYPELCQIIASKDSGIESIEDLRGKRVSVGDAGSGVEFNAKHILEIYGMDIDEDIQKQNLGFGDSADALRDGRIDAFFCVAGTPTTAITDLAMSTDINMVEIDKKHYKKLSEEYGYFVYETVPEDTYRGVDETNTVAVKATLIASKDLPEDVVYDLTKALFEKKDDIERVHMKGQELNLDTALDGIAESVPLHPGAEKYYREVGLID